MRIGVFDSGIGGMTVLRHLTQAEPNHEYLYFGDTANVPYGSKSPATIKTLCESAALRIKTHQLDLLIVACNTASCIALPEIRKVMGGTPVVGVVEAGIHSVVSHSPDEVLILGTQATIQSHIYLNSLKNFNTKLEIYEQSCPLLVPMIEEGWIDHPILISTLQLYLGPYQNLVPKNKNRVALLGCTHYPWIRNQIARVLPDWKLIDSGEAVLTLIRPFIKAQGKSSITWHFSDKESIAAFTDLPSSLENF